MRSKLSICRVVERSDRGNNGANESNVSSLLDYCRVQPIEDRVSTPKGGGGSNMFLSSVKRKEQNEAEDSKMTEFLFLIVNSSLLFPLSSLLFHFSTFKHLLYLCIYETPTTNHIIHSIALGMWRE